IAGALGSTRLGDRLPVYATLGVSLAAAAVIGWYLPEGHERTSTAVPHAHHRRWGALGEALGIPHGGRMLVLYFASYLAFNFYYSAFPVHAIQNLGFGITASGAYFAILSVLMVAVQGLVLPWASRRWTDIQLMVAGSLMLCANFLLLLTTNLAAVGASVALFALGNGVMWPSAVALLSKVAGEEEQGLVQGVASSAGNLASIAGLIAGGLVFETLGAWTFMLAAALITVAGAVALPLRGLPR